MIENTTNRDPFIHLLGVMDEGQSGYIEGMESQGQRSLVQSEMLPTEGDWDRAAELGVFRGEEVRGDALFTHATLPDGWRKVATDHSMGSEVIDDRGVPRIGIFYKAAFYDRRASFHVINVGWHVATHVGYADEPRLPEYWDKLTADEKHEAVEGVKSRIAEIRETQKFSDDSDGYWQARIDKQQTALELLTEAGA